MLSTPNPPAPYRGQSLAPEPADSIQIDPVGGGEMALPRFIPSSNTPLTSGIVKFSVFTAQRTEQINSIATFPTTAAGATPTLCRMGVWELDARDGIYKLVAATVNDTTLWNSNAAIMSRTLAAPFTKVAGRRYMCGALCVTAASVPSVLAHSLSNAGGYQTLLATGAGAVTALLTGQTDLPLSVAYTQFGIASGVAQFFLAPT